ncbi:MAG: energy transducer TonB [Chthoniobacterales bacterium]
MSDRLLLLLCALSLTSASAETPTFMAGRQMPPDQVQLSFSGEKFDVPPKFLRGEAPIYPIRQLRYGGGGFATIGFVIDASGRTREFTVVKTNYKYFAGAAIDAIKGWRFEPARRNGKPVPVHATIPCSFSTDLRKLRH